MKPINIHEATNKTRNHFVGFLDRKVTYFYKAIFYFFVGPSRKEWSVILRQELKRCRR